LSDLVNGSFDRRAIVFLDTAPYTPQVKYSVHSSLSSFVESNNQLIDVSVLNSKKNT
jgi:hypothetical protein